MKAYKNGTAVSAAAPVVMFPAVNNGVPAVMGYRCTGDGSGALFKIFAGAHQTKTGVTAAGQTVMLTPVTAGFLANDYVIIQLADGTMEWNSVASVQANVSLTLNVALGISVTATTKVFRMDPIASMPCGSATVANNGGVNGICFGRKQMPVAGAVIGGTSANVISRFSVSYI